RAFALPTRIILRLVLKCRGAPGLSLEFVDIAHAYGASAVLSEINVAAAPAEITCLLGPSGCGKTTLLRLAAGLLDVQNGEIRLDGAVLAAPGASPPPEARPVGLVFQEGALFPHLTVERNIGFGVRDARARKGRVDDLMAQMDLAGFAARYPNTLSGGQQQRVALARAIAPAPRVLLLDEPFANVDIVRRRALREETRRVLKAREAIAILVTHDPEEALEVADRIAVMEGGRIVQAGAPRDVYDAPVKASVGCLFGDGQVFKGRRRDNGVETPFGFWAASSFAAPLPDAAMLDVLVRPEAVVLDPDGSDGVVEDVRLAGAFARVRMKAPSGAQLWGNAPRSAAFDIGQSVGVSVKNQAVFAFPAAP
ncbi:MAG: ABC transporter ATP-binding protein, partial [Pseudomonadota bacterium]